RRLPAADADDEGDGHGRAHGVGPGVAGRDHARRQPRRRIRTGELTMPKDPAKSDDRSGYREEEPRDKEDARRSGAKKQPNPDAGGLDRAPEGDGKNEGA